MLFVPKPILNLRQDVSEVIVLAGALAGLDSETAELDLKDNGLYELAGYNHCLLSCSNMLELRFILFAVGFHESQISVLQHEIVPIT